MLRSICVGALVAAGLTVSCAAAGIAFTSATRFVRADAGSAVTTDDALGFGQYDKTLYNSTPATLCFLPPGTVEEGYAEQHSSIAVPTATFAGRVFGADPEDCGGAGCGRGSSSLTLAFTVTADARWTLNSRTSLQSSPVTSYELRIKDSSNAVVTYTSFFSDGEHTGLLSAGDYQLTLSAGAGWCGAGAGSGFIDYDWVFNLALLGACCAPDGSCSVVTPAACSDAGGIYRGEGSACDAPACQGACCHGGLYCTLASDAAACASGHWAGPTTVCNATGNHVMPCCEADFDGSGTVTIQDLFQFLAAFFSGNPAADFDRSSAVSVGDIFAFCAAWFAGCA